MAPNILLGSPGRDSDEASQEENVFGNQPSVDGAVPQVPEIFRPHLPQHFQDPDSPNLHQISPAVRIVLEEESKNFSPSRNPSAGTVIGSLRPSNPRSRVLEEELVLERGRATDVEKSELDDPTKDTRESSSVLRPQSKEFFTPSGHPSLISQLPNLEIPVKIIPSGEQTQTKDFPPTEGDGTSATSATRQIVKAARPPSSSEAPPTTTTTSTTIYTHQHGVLKIPGHAPEAPADLNLTHHDRTIDISHQSGEGGIIVKNDSSILTPQEATTLILVGLCSVFLVFICLIMFIKKIRRERIEQKVDKEVDGMKAQPRYEATATSHHPNPLSLLPPDILRALMQPLAGKSQESFEEPVPSFLAMEPPAPGNQLGRLWFSVFYDYVKTTLVLRILHARYVKGRGSATNPGSVWVEACVLTPMNTIKASNKTDKRRASLAPVFNQSFTFMVDDEEVTQYLLRLTLYDFHPQNGEKAVGSVIVPLSAVDLCSSDIISRDLQ